MKKLISALLIPVICLCLTSCSGSNSDPNDITNKQNNTTAGDAIAQEYIGVWKSSDIAFNLDGDSWIETLTIALNEDGTATYRGKNVTWEYDDKYGKYGTIELTLESGDTVSLIIDEKDGKTVLRALVNIYYRESDFAEAMQ